MRKELTAQNVPNLQEGDVVFITDPKSGNLVEFAFEAFADDKTRVYLTTVDSDLDGYNQSEGPYPTGKGSYGDYIYHFRTRLDPHKGAAAMTREHLILTLQCGKFEIDGQEGK